jgi:hypothetical protein
VNLAKESESESEKNVANKFEGWVGGKSKSIEGNCQATKRAKI